VASRLRGGEIVAGVAGVALLALLFGVLWFAGQSGWQSLSALRWLLLVTGVSAIGLTVVGATRRAPAIPVTMSVIVTALGAITTVALIVRLAFGSPGPDAGAFAGLIAVVACTAGSFWSLRVEDGWEPGPDHPVDVVSLDTLSEQVGSRDGP
jgi:hypothetical protein